MKKLFFFLIAAAFFASSAHAAPYSEIDPTSGAGRWDAGIHVAEAFGMDDGIDDAPLVAGSVVRGLNNRWAAGASVGWANMDLTTDSGVGATLNGGEVRITPVFAEVFYRFEEPKRPVTPYLNLALGALLVNQHGNQDLRVNRLHVSDTNGFAIKFAGGLDWSVTPNWIYRLEIGYVSTDAKVKIISDANGLELDSQALDYWFAGMALIYRFD